MRERRWEMATPVDFEKVLLLSQRLQGFGFNVVSPKQDLICYVEEWKVNSPADILLLDKWPNEDITLVATNASWEGDFYLLAGAYHTVYRSYQRDDTYCSISHPWSTSSPMQMHDSQGMFWLGFRGKHHGFIRVRLQTEEVITPGETRANNQQPLWIKERENAFQVAIENLNLPLTLSVEQEKVVVSSLNGDAVLFCSWPDAFGPCQFEYNLADPFYCLVPATQLSKTLSTQCATVRAYMTGFDMKALDDFWRIQPEETYAYRCCVHCKAEDLSTVQEVIQPSGRLYATICEFQTQELLPHGYDAWAIVGVIASENKFKVEVRLNRAPLSEADMSSWLEAVIGYPMVYSPLPAFP